MSDTTPETLLKSWLARSLNEKAAAWLEERLEIAATGDQQKFFLSFGFTPRKVGKSDLALSTEDLADADQARTGWNPRGWSVDQAARTLLVLTFPSNDKEKYLDSLDKLFSTGSVDELVALYQSLPILPYQESHKLRAAEGVRTNIRTAFCAVAHRNPYPAEFLDESAWNQMVLKALFVEALLDPIIGMDERTNKDLAHMLVDFAHERWAASRTVSPELWRNVGPHADEGALNDLEKVLREGTELEQKGAALTLSKCPAGRAAELLRARPELASAIENGVLSWSRIAEELEGN
ncbi:MAG: EboA domain-containing protein [Planctomycetota bacterium]|jgi:hypothetical protein|nr:EboA domain-containing protein [Planctomycetota bacterium]MDP6506354.1 EboA domain-containing protein [Planctomycetota bacterium]